MFVEKVSLLNVVLNCYRHIFGGWRFFVLPSIDWELHTSNKNIYIFKRNRLALLRLRVLILQQVQLFLGNCWFVTHGPPIFKLKLSSVHTHKFQSLIQLKWNESNNLQPEMFYLCFLLTNTNVRIARILCSLEVAFISK